MEKNKIVNELITIFWVFIIGSFVGFIFEAIVVIFQKGYYEIRQGLIYGPLIPVYGIGAIAYYLTLKHIKTRNIVKVFLISMVLGGITEYLCSFFQEVIFNTISWDYSHLPFNLNGRTSLLHCTYWGIAGIMYITLVEPFTQKLKKISHKVIVQVITIVLAILIAFDIIISCVACIRQKNRSHNIKPKNAIEEFLDKNYPDEFLNKIYSNRIVKEKEGKNE